MPSSAGWTQARAAACVLLCAALLAACARSGDDAQQQLHALGTIVTLRYYGADAAAMRAATTELEQLYRDAGRDWYPWHAPGNGGELMRVNAALARGDPVAVSAPLAALLKRSAELEARSGGLFNVTLGALTALWGFNDPLQEAWQPPAAADVASLVADGPGSAQLHWDGLQLRSDSRRIVIDPGGIAKGALLGMSVEILKSYRIDNAIVDLGGDLTVLGTVNGRDARIGIRDPAGGEPVGVIEAHGGETIVTSGTYERYFEYGGQRYAHIIDPRSGRPARDTASVTVIHEDPLLADAAATALLIAGPAAFDATCRALGIDRAILIGRSGDLRLTAKMRERVN